MDTEADKTHLANQFLTGLRTRNGELLRSIMKDEVTWSLPGNSLISGLAQGVDAVVGRAQTIRDHGVSFSLKHILVGHHGVALSLHNTAQRENLVFDEHLATVLNIQDGKVTEINTYLADVENAQRFLRAIMTLGPGNAPTRAKPVTFQG